MKTVSPKNILVNDRIRREYGDIDELANSIREFGLIQPIVLTKPTNWSEGKSILIAGNRRLKALERVGIKELEYGVHFIWYDPTDEVQQKAAELEENLKRKDLTWQEQLEAKKKLLELMESIHGKGVIGQPRKTGKRETGFGVNKLAAMLGEAVGKTSQDLQIAAAIEKFPMLKKAETKGSAMRKLSILGAIVDMASKKSPETEDEKLWTLYEGDFNDNVDKVPDNSVDLVYTDLPFGVDLAKMSKHVRGVVDYHDSRDSTVGRLPEVAIQAFRILANDRYAIFFFGSNYYTELCTSLQDAGFTINPVPIIWFKHTRSTENPNTRYANAYDPALVAMKGSPVFIRPGQTNVIDIPAVTQGQKLQIAQQPVELVKRFIGDMTGEGATVVDFMCGSGTTGVAAVGMKRRVILFEKNSMAAEIARKRLEAL